MIKAIFFWDCFKTRTEFLSKKKKNNRILGDFQSINFIWLKMILEGQFFSLEDSYNLVTQKGLKEKKEQLPGGGGRERKGGRGRNARTNSDKDSN